jgi:hypothetical protein
MRTANKGKTVPAQGEQQQRVPRTPNERDESADSQAQDDPSRTVGRQASEDVERGLVDTDKGRCSTRSTTRSREGAADPIKNSACRPRKPAGAFQTAERASSLRIASMTPL